MLNGNIVRHRKAHKIVRIAKLCEAYHSTPDAIRRSYDKDLELIADCIFLLRQKQNPLGGLK